MSDYALGEIDRRMACMVQHGTVEEVSYQPPLCRVRIGDWVSDWMPWKTAAAGVVRFWRPPSVGEQASMFAPSGELAGAYAAPGYYSDQHGGSARSSPSETAWDYPDGASEVYDHEKHEYRVDVPAGGRIVFRIGGTVLELRADGATLRTQQFLGDIPDSTFTGNTTTEKLLTFNGGMQGKAGGDGGPAVSVQGGAIYTDDIEIAGKSFVEHRHMEEGDGAPVSPPL
ncbi:phage baseplate assembly protein V [Burkholderia multivorans]|uniref:phage baseplate assembly protein V n=1 Tax=Burkholderia multivorans TaxID=87883 RepID=UPI0019B35F82|nr:phage baseplate assembly protein V [Burkholderia multivorans]MCO7335139.1 phage baseplate assembly protein V [Burkholderia multivorans]MCO7343817.1 phage baseplate assembly protein V [Burkholderia multivorans]MCO7344385.1 phage baseplate assembly protein V [Burkholderia multivorans]CAB5287167.1 phage baseplate assembly protein V [Burkholderia multivorans]CAB5299295.1 phage baseplate assembly protein V [Burkholderia multivorans]